MAITRLQFAKSLDSEYASTEIKSDVQKKDSTRHQNGRNKTRQFRPKTSNSKVAKRKTPSKSVILSSKRGQVSIKSLESTQNIQFSKAANVVPTRLRECTICAENKGKRQFPIVEKPPGCGHVISACRACITRHMTIEIEKHGHLHQVPCLDCKTPLGYSYLESLIPRRDLEKMKIIEDRKATESHPRFRFCLAPKCHAGQIHHRDDTNVVVCNACGAQSCFQHAVPWHAGYTCERYDASHPDAVALRTSEEVLQTTAKKCPGPGCLFYVEKDGGCDGIFCTRCNHYWNWAQVAFGETKVTPMPVFSA